MERGQTEIIVSESRLRNNLWSWIKFLSMSVIFPFFVCVIVYLCRGGRASPTSSRRRPLRRSGSAACVGRTSTTSAPSAEVHVGHEGIKSESNLIRPSKDVPNHQNLNKTTSLDSYYAWIENRRLYILMHQHKKPKHLTLVFWMSHYGWRFELFSTFTCCYFEKLNSILAIFRIRKQLSAMDFQVKASQVNL